MHKNSTEAESFGIVFENILFSSKSDFNVVFGIIVYTLISIVSYCNKVNY